MAGLLVKMFFGKSEQEKNAELALTQAEDRLMAFDPREASDLGIHAGKESDRTQVIVARQRDSHAELTRKTDRNLTATLSFGVILLFKGVVTIDQVKHFLVAIFASS